MEYEADYLGLMLMLKSVGEDVERLPPFCFLGPELFFTFLDIEERSFSFFSLGKDNRSKGSIKHPPTSERRKRIKNYLNQSLPEFHKETYNALSEFLENVLEVLWENVKNDLSPNESIKK
jgi:hypothetical protein